MTYIVGSLGSRPVLLGILNDASMEVEQIIQKKNEELKEAGIKKKYPRSRALRDAINLRIKDGRERGYSQVYATLLQPI